MKLIAGFLLFFSTANAAGFSTYIGDGLPYNVAAMAVDRAGNTYLTGSRLLALPGILIQPLSDVFVTKLDPAGKLVFTVSFGGKVNDQASAIAIDPAGNIYIAGTTTSPDFPLSNARELVGNSFLMKLTGDGRAILYSTRFTGGISALTTDASGNLYLTGDGAPNVPAGTPTFGNGIPGAFVTKLDPAGIPLYSGYFGGTSITCVEPRVCAFGSRVTQAVSISVDASGNAYVAGNTNTTDLPTTPGALSATGVGAFVAKVNAKGTSLAYLTYLSSANFATGSSKTAGTILNAISVDAQGNAYLAGATSDASFPVTKGALQTTYTAPAGTILGVPASDAFLAKLNPAGAAMIWATYLGGSDVDSATVLAPDSAGNLWVVGVTSSTSFPNSSGGPAGADFLIEINAAGSALLDSSRFADQSVRRSVGFDASSNLVRVAGTTGVVAAIPPTQTALRIDGFTNAAGGPITGHIAYSEIISIYGAQLGPLQPMQGVPDASGFLPTALGGVQVLLAGTPARLLYVSATQINAIVEPPNENPASLEVVNGNQRASFRIVRFGSLPEVFRNPDGSAAAANQDGTINSATNPAKRGSIMTIWASGTGYPAVDPGRVATTPSPACFVCEVRIVTGGVTILSSPGLAVVYAGSAPGMVAGVTQINFRVPTSASGPSIFVAVAVGGSVETSLPARVFVDF